MFGQIAYAIIGVRIDGKKLSKEIKSRGCKCDVVYTRKAPKFCPECGSQFFHKEKQLIKDVAEQGSVTGEYKLLKKYPVIFPISDEEPENQKVAYIAVKVAEDHDYQDENKNVSQLPSEKQIKQFKNDLGSLGLWDSAKFRLWSIFHREC